MTIDEVIVNENKSAEARFIMSDISIKKEAIENNKRCAEYHKQLAEWLEELKQLRFFRQEVMESEDGYIVGYRKAIDDFVSLAKEHDYKHRGYDITNCVLDFIEF